MLKQEILKALSDCGFEHPSEGLFPRDQDMTSLTSLVQHQCIPQAIMGTDVLCQAKSGMVSNSLLLTHAEG